MSGWENDTIIGSLGWYLDIEEYSFAHGSGTWNPPGGTGNDQLRNPDGSDDVPYRSYSVPLPFDVNQTLSVAQFVSGIQNALDARADELEQALYVEAASQSLGAARRYEITASIPVFRRGHYSHQQGFQQDELAIKYEIECVLAAGPGGAPPQLGWNNKLFKIKFVTGPHGSTGNFLQLGGDIGGTVEVVNNPATEMGNFPFYSKVVTMQDNPPTTPDVEIIPYREVNDRILILVNGTGGTYYEKPIIIEAEDAEHFINAYIVQGGQFAPEVTAAEKLQIVKNTDILFRGDDPTVEYQMFRTDVAPSSYQDFAEGEKTDIVEYVGEDQISTLATHTDIIRPNTKYYYCFRAIDVHGHLSNPTPVFQVEMIDNNGQIYPIIESYKFESARQLSLTKGAKRFIYISPSTRQIYFEPEDTFQAEVGTAPAQMPLLGKVDGIAPGSRVWNGIYKIRLTSKKTGRKLDLNITFKNTGQRNP